jgi:hypothetical protein
MTEFWLFAIGIFLIVIYTLHKLGNNYFGKKNRKDKHLFNIYHWEILVALSSGLTYLVLLILKSTSILPF